MGDFGTFGMGFAKDVVDSRESSIFREDDFPAPGVARL